MLISKVCCFIIVLIPAFVRAHIVLGVELVGVGDALEAGEDHSVGCDHPSPGISLNPGLTTLISGLRRVLFGDGPAVLGVGFFPSFVARVIG